MDLIFQRSLSCQACGLLTQVSEHPLYKIEETVVINKIKVQPGFGSVTVNDSVG